MRKQVNPLVAIVVIVVVVLVAGVWFYKRATSGAMDQVIPGIGRVEGGRVVSTRGGGRGAGRPGAGQQAPDAEAESTP